MRSSRASCRALAPAVDGLARIDERQPVDAQTLSNSPPATPQLDDNPALDPRRELIAEIAACGDGSVRHVRHNTGVELEIEMLTNIRAALDEHASECCQSPKAILLHVGNHQLIGWDEVLGLPVLADPRVEPKRFRVVCGDDGWGGYFDGERVWWTEDGTPHHAVEADSAAA